MLTAAEKVAARTAPCRFGVGHGYGTPAIGYCPIGAVAALRGVVLEVDHDGEYSAYVANRQGACVVPHPYFNRLRRATEDVVAWSGYPTLEAFLRAWEVRGAACFPEEE